MKQNAFLSREKPQGDFSGIVKSGDAAILRDTLQDIESVKVLRGGSH